MYLYQNCKHLTLVKGHRFASICDVHLVLGNATRYVPLKIGQFVGSPFLFEYNRSPQVNQITLQKQKNKTNIKLAMGEEALSANCTVRTTKGVHYIKLDRWGDSRHRTISYKKNNKVGGRKIKFDIQRFWNEKAQKAAAARMASIPTNPSPPPNWRAEVLRPKIIPRPTY